MKNLQELLSTKLLHIDEVIYVIFCENDKFYVGHTNNLIKRLKYGHFGPFRNRGKFLKQNPPIDLLIYIRTGVNYNEPIDVYRWEDYVTIIVGEKYGAQNVFGGFRHVKDPNKRVEFSNNYDFTQNKNTILKVDKILDFELPELDEIKYFLRDYLEDETILF